ncbi:MAG: hypothetical protein ABSC90_07255 [Acidimicrobiales bacterium]
MNLYPGLSILRGIERDGDDQMPPKDNREKRIQVLVDDYRAYNEAIEGTRGYARQYASEKAWTVGQLREMLSVAEIANRLDITPPAVYSMLNEAASSGPDPVDIPNALAQLKRARKAMDDLVAPITDQGISATPARLERAGDAVSGYYAAWASYVRALRAEGRPVPNRVPF